MLREMTVCALLLVLPLADRAAEQPEPTETIIRLRVRPAPAPKPALRYQLLPEMREVTPGNAAVLYPICFMEQNNFWFSKEAVENREKWQTMPLKELPLKELHGFGYGKGSGPLRFADEASRLEHVDWQLLPRVKREGVDLLLPDLHQWRTLASALQVRFRVELAEGRLDDALVTAKTMFALARNLSAHPTLISNLVGVAIANIAIGPLDEMLQQPGCPNLFWALTDLPKPLVDFRKALQTERIFLTNVFEPLDEKGPMTAGQLNLAVERIRGLVKTLNGLPHLKGDVGEWLVGQAKNEARVAAGRKRLVEVGLDADKVKSFPALQVVILDERLHYEIDRDEGMKAMTLPYWQAEPLLLRRAVPRDDEPTPLFVGLAGSFRKVRQTQARLEQRFALLCCVEALRMHAAEHGGKLPVALVDVKLPLPVDPITGKAFSYKLDGETATLRGTAPSGMEKVASYNVRYEVTIAR